MWLGSFLCMFTMWRANVPTAIHIMKVLSSLLSSFNILDV
jgi:hypothetical protein